MGIAGSLCLGSPVAAQDDAEIAGLVRSYQDAFNRCDVDLFAGLLHWQLSGYGVSGGLSQGRDAAGRHVAPHAVESMH